MKRLLHPVTIFLFLLIMTAAFRDKVDAQVSLLERESTAPRLDQIGLNLPQGYTSKRVSDRMFFYFPASSNENPKEGIRVGVDISDIHKSRTKQQHYDYACRPLPEAPKCGTTEIDGKTFVVMSHVTKERLEKAYWHFGDGYSIYFGIHAGNNKDFNKLETVVESAKIPIK